MTLKRGSWLKATALVVVVAMFVGMGLLGGSGQNGLKSNHFKVEGVLSATGANTVASGTQLGNGFMYQGRLTDANGNPVTNGSYHMVFKLYDAAIGGTALETIPSSGALGVQVTNGLFSAVLEFSSRNFTGEARYLSIQVGTDTEMTPRQAIYAVPYAYSLKPGAMVEGDVSWYNYVLHIWNYPPVFEVDNTATGGPAIYGGSTSTTGGTIGVKGESKSPSGFGGYFVNSASGGTGLYGYGDTGVEGKSNSSTGTGGYFWNSASGGTGLRADGPAGGVAIKATGSGVIQSSAKSYIWVSGTAFEKGSGDDSHLTVSYGNSGKAWFMRSAVGIEAVNASITIPAVLYGQNVKVTKATVYYQCSSENSFISDTNVTCMSSDGRYSVLGSNNTDYKSTTFSSYDVPTDSSFNTLNADYGAVNVNLLLDFANIDDCIVIGGVRLELEHD